MQLLIAHRDRTARRALECVAADAGPLEATTMTTACPEEVFDLESVFVPE